MLGAERDLVDRRVVRYSPELVVAIPREEARRYAREYRRAVTDGSLKVRTAAEWSAQNAPPPGEPEPASEPEPEPPSEEPEAPFEDPPSEEHSEPLSTRKFLTTDTRQARLSPLTADDPPDKDEAPLNADFQSRR